MLLLRILKYIFYFSFLTILKLLFDSINKLKIKDRIIVDADATEEQITQKALGSEKVIAAIADKEVRKIIVIKSRLVNIVAG